MYEEPRPLVDVGKLPAPLLVVEDGEKVWLENDGSILWTLFDSSNLVHEDRINKGKLFKTEEEARYWLDAMTAARR